MARRDEDDEDETFELDDTEVIGETAKALKVSTPNLNDPVWIPKSVIHDDSGVYDNTEDGRGPGLLVVARWFAEKEGWL